jgi:hypothetical protein
MDGEGLTARAWGSVAMRRKAIWSLRASRSTPAFGRAVRVCDAGLNLGLRPRLVWVGPLALFCSVGDCGGVESLVSLEIGG